jgi:hypothetical protein
VFDGAQSQPTQRRANPVGPVYARRNRRLRLSFVDSGSIKRHDWRQLNINRRSRIEVQKYIRLVIATIFSLLWTD